MRHCGVTMPNVTYLSGWQAELCIPLVLWGGNRLADFNRLLKKGLSKTEQLQQGGHFESADRDGFVLQLKSRFDEV